NRQRHRRAACCRLQRGGHRQALGRQPAARLAGRDRRCRRAGRGLMDVPARPLRVMTVGNGRLSAKDAKGAKESHRENLGVTSRPLRMLLAAIHGMGVRSAGLLCLGVMLAGASAAQADEVSAGAVSETVPAAVDRLAREAIAHYRLPGMAIGVVEDGEVVFARGYGETLAGSGTPVDTRTMFKIASNSKAMTVALLARLVDQGK